eukprot:910137-Prorocentrum_minimum.AAC.1
MSQTQRFHSPRYVYDRCTAIGRDLRQIKAVRNAPIGRRTRGYILTTNQSDAGRAGIFSRRTNRAQDAR